MPVAAALVARLAALHLPMCTCLPTQRLQKKAPLCCVIRICATIAWTASGHHAAVNFGQYDYSSFTLNVSAGVRRGIPKPDDTANPAYKVTQAAPGRSLPGQQRGQAKQQLDWYLLSSQPTAQQHAQTNAAVLQQYALMQPGCRESGAKGSGQPIGQLMTKPNTASKKRNSSLPHLPDAPPSFSPHPSHPASCDARGMHISFLSTAPRPVPPCPALQALVDKTGDAQEGEFLTYLGDFTSTLKVMTTVKLLSSHADDEQTLNERNTMITVRGPGGGGAGQRGHLSVSRGDEGCHSSRPAVKQACCRQCDSAVVCRTYHDCRRRA